MKTGTVFVLVGLLLQNAALRPSRDVPSSVKKVALAIIGQKMEFKTPPQSPSLVKRSTSFSAARAQFEKPAQAQFEKSALVAQACQQFKAQAKQGKTKVGN